MATIEDRVASGAFYLDCHVPGWRDDIDPRQLDIQRCSMCILGQLFGSYGDGLNELKIDDIADPGSLLASWNLGFCTMPYSENSHHEFMQLEDEWRRILPATV